jgi:hypothetical protein
LNPRGETNCAVKKTTYREAYASRWPFSPLRHLCRDFMSLADLHANAVRQIVARIDNQSLVA